MFWVLKKTSHLAGYFEHPQHMLWLRNKKINIVLRTVLTKVLCALITIASSPKHLAVLFTGWHSTVGNMSGNRFKSDCRSRGREFDPRQVPYFRGDWLWNNFYGHSPPFRWIIQEGLLSVTSESMCTKYWLTACSSLPRLDSPAMTIAVDLGRKATKQTKQNLVGMILTWTSMTIVQLVPVGSP